MSSVPDSAKLAHALAESAWKHWQKGSAFDVIDPVFEAGSNSIRDMVRYLHIGLLCVQENVAVRPTIASVILMLSSSSLSLSLKVPSEPAFFMHSSIDPEMPQIRENNSATNESNRSKKDGKLPVVGDYNSGMDLSTQTTNEDPIFELCPRWAGSCNKTQSRHVLLASNVIREKVSLQEKSSPNSSNAVAFEDLSQPLGCKAAGFVLVNPSRKLLNNRLKLASISGTDMNGARYVLDLDRGFTTGSGNGIALGIIATFHC
ncbi:hypothetical protein RJ639_011858 [Escallonia herrerae]|uniref:Uncharacterized protein n=1 Tax=Escallonia herrerae TaxID=1293975 RepID=A0AA88VN63_9ASTE|nr:hypothetical protein RJ639_011858 [Escallonia herrerae]